MKDLVFLPLADSTPEEEAGPSHSGRIKPLVPSISYLTYELPPSHHSYAVPATPSGRCFDVRLARAGPRYSTVPTVGGGGRR